MDANYCTRCGKRRGERWEHGDAHCGGSIFLTACSQIHDAITGTHTEKINSPFYIDTGFQSGTFRWGKDGDAKLCWHCNRALLRHIGKFFLDATGPAPKEEVMGFDVRCKKCDREFNAHTWTTKFCCECAKARTAERRALYREAYMAALGGTAGLDICATDVMVRANTIGLVTVTEWDAMMAELEGE